MSEASPTRVGPGLKADVAHGPEKSWETVGLSVQVTITLPTSLVKQARANGYVISRVAREALDRLIGGSDLSRIESELKELEDRRRILESAREHLVSKRSQEDSAAEKEKARLAAISKLAEAYWSDARVVSFPDRPSMRRSEAPRSTNLSWVRSRIRAVPELRGSSAEEVLDLILSLRPGARA